jgi:hypothetical protein
MWTSQQSHHVNITALGSLHVQPCVLKTMVFFKKVYDHTQTLLQKAISWVCLGADSKD